MKDKIRKEIFNRLRTQSKEERAEKSRRIRDILFQEEDFRNARCVMWYVSTEEEVDTREMIKETFKMGKKVCVPVIVKDSKRIVASEIVDLSALTKGPYGIYQPEGDSIRQVALKDIDLVVVPGVAFDACKVRLGRGHGYYDRFLKDLPGGAKTIGLAFHFQVVEKLPRDSHDVPVSKTITA